MNETGAERRYARALLEAAEERGALDRVREDLQALQDLIRASEELQGFLTDPLIHPEQKQNAFQAMFSGALHDLTMNFLSLLCEKRRERALQGIIQSFLHFLDERQGIARAQVRSAAALTPEQQAQLAERLSAYSGKQVRLEVEVDEGLKAGFVARLGDQVFDGTLEAQLHRLRRRLAMGL